MNNYEILGLKKGATLKEIKAKFRELAMINHPDRGGDAKEFIKINNAYEALLKGEIGEVKEKPRPQPARDPFSQYQQGGQQESYTQQRARQQYSAAQDQMNRQQAYQYQARQKTAQYRFESIKKDIDGYLVNFFVDGVDYVEIYGKDFNRVGHYTVKGRVGIVNLSVKWEDAKKGKYMFECWLYDGRGGMAKKTYKVEPPKKPTLWDKVRSGIKNLFK